MAEAHVIENVLKSTKSGQINNTDLFKMLLAGFKAV